MIFLIAHDQAERLRTRSGHDLRGDIISQTCERIRSDERSGNYFRFAAQALCRSRPTRRRSRTPAKFGMAPLTKFAKGRRDLDPEEHPSRFDDVVGGTAQDPDGGSAFARQHRCVGGGGHVVKGRPRPIGSVVNGERRPGSGIGQDRLARRSGAACQTIASLGETEGRRRVDPACWSVCPVDPAVSQPELGATLSDDGQGSDARRAFVAQDRRSIGGVPSRRASASLCCLITTSPPRRLKSRTGPRDASRSLKFAPIADLSCRLAASSPVRLSTSQPRFRSRSTTSSRLSGAGKSAALKSRVRS
jgi:hypothetical protein